MPTIAHPTPPPRSRPPAAAENSRYYPALLLVASTGLRKGECFASKWSDVDLDAGALVLRATLGCIGDRLVISEPKTVR